MEGGLTNSPFSVYGNFENNYDPNSWLQPSPPPLSTLDSIFWNQENSFSSQEKLFNSEVANRTKPLFDDHPNNNVVFSGFPSRFGIESEFVEGFSSSFQQETVFVDRLIHLDDDSDSSLVQGIKENKIGSSSTPWIKGQWTLEEDRKLIQLVEKYGYRKWAIVAQHMVGRIGKQCRERWQNHLRPDIKKDHYWSEEEERLLLEAHQRVGNKWAEIAKYIPGRTENSIKNHWNATKRKQTSKRKIKKPAALNGMKQSVLLEEYIRKIYFNQGSSTSNSNSGNSYENHVNDQNAPPPPSDDDAPPISYLTNENYEDEMNFMTNLFRNKDNIGTSSINARENNNNNNINTSNLTSAVQMPRGVVGNNFSASSSIMPNMEQNGFAIGIPREEALNAFLYPEFCFSSSTFDGSLGSSQ